MPPVATYQTSHLWVCVGSWAPGPLDAEGDAPATARETIHSGTADTCLQSGPRTPGQTGHGLYAHRQTVKRLMDRLGRSHTHLVEGDRGNLKEDERVQGRHEGLDDALWLEVAW